MGREFFSNVLMFAADENAIDKFDGHAAGERVAKSLLSWGGIMFLLALVAGITVVIISRGKLRANNRSTGLPTLLMVLFGCIATPLISLAGGAVFGGATSLGTEFDKGLKPIATQAVDAALVAAAKVGAEDGQMINVDEQKASAAVKLALLKPKTEAFRNGGLFERLKGALDSAQEVGEEAALKAMVEGLSKFSGEVPAATVTEALRAPMEKEVNGVLNQITGDIKKVGYLGLAGALISLLIVHGLSLFLCSRRA